MSDLLAEVDRVLTEWDVNETALLLAVSGGADSTALVRVLAELRETHRLSLSAVHVDHQLRAESDADAAFVAELCKAHAIPLRIRQVDVARVAAERRIGLEEAGRDLRREIYESVAREKGTGWVCVGHTVDDQAETVLHRILRGTGLSGLAGIPGVSTLSAEPPIRLFRPLLGVSREAIETWLRDLGQPWREDSTNADRAFTRNRIRYELLPLLERDFNPQVRKAVARLSRQAAEAGRVLRMQGAAALAAAVIEQQPQVVRLNADVLVPFDSIVRREALILLWSEQEWPRQALGSERLAELDQLIECGRPAALSLPGGVVVSRRGSVVLLIRERSG